MDYIKAMFAVLAAVAALRSGLLPIASLSPQLIAAAREATCP